VTKFNVSFDVHDYDMIDNRNQKYRGNRIVIFYRNDLGLWPYYESLPDGTLNAVNEGLPQVGAELNGRSDCVSVGEHH
jgi:hypothetical protein